MIDFYTKTLKEWSETFNSQIMKTADFPEAMKDMPKRISDSIMTSVEIYNAWIMGLQNLANDGFEITRKLANGECEIELEKVFSTSRETYDNISSIITKLLKDTPFEGMTQIDQAIRKAVDSFSDERKAITSFMKETCAFSSQMLNLFKSSGKEIREKFLNIPTGDFEKAADDYNQIIDNYEKILKHAAEGFRPLASLDSAYKPAVENMIALAKHNAGISVSYMAAMLSPCLEAGKLNQEFFKLTQEFFKNGHSMDKFYKNWLEFTEKARTELAKNVYDCNKVAELIQKNTEYVKSTMKLCKNAVAPVTANNYASETPEISEAA